jgi:hypothetical protein
MRIGLLAALAAGCSSESGTAPAPKEPAPGQAQPPGGPEPEAAILAKGPPPEVGPANKVVEKVAAYYNVGLARCPMAGGGRARQLYGTERDHLFDLGPLWEMEWDPATAPPWDPLFDEVSGEQDWLSLLAVPGTTKAWIGTRTFEIAYTFPPAVAGQTVVCTEAHRVKPREVKGSVKGDGPLPTATLVVGCSDQATKVAPDGTFVATVTPPCTLWAEAPTFRSQKVRVEEGADPLELQLALAPDTLQNADRSWSDEGKAEAEEVLQRQSDRYSATAALLQQLAPDFAGDPVSKMKVDRWTFDYQNWGRTVQASAQALNQPAPK